MRDPNKPSKDKPHWPGWFYGPNGEAEIFQSQADVPVGWEDHPSKVNSAGNSAAIAPETAEPQPIEIIEAKKANNSADDLLASKPQIQKTFKPRGRPRKK